MTRPVSRLVAAVSDLLLVALVAAVFVVAAGCAMWAGWRP